MAPTAGELALLVVVLTAGSLLIDRTVRFDAVGWVRWGHDLASTGGFDTTGLPSWKPLPLLATTPLAALLGAPAAQVAWLALVRAAALAALVLIARRTSLAAAALLACAPAWWTTTLGGGIEPVVVLLGAAAVTAHAAHRHRAALALLTLAALGREEALALIPLYALVALPKNLWPLAATATAAAAAAWLGGDWLGSGDPLHGGHLARAAGLADAAARGRAPGTPTTPALLALIAALPVLTALALRGLHHAKRTNNTTAPLLAAAGALWAASDLALLALGYPLPPRFLLPAIAAATPLFALGLTTTTTPPPRRPTP
jgi:hypothetical protein